jgi:hypothetical protein
MKRAPNRERRMSWTSTETTTRRPFHERTSKRRRGFPSESRVKRGRRIVHGDKVLHEKRSRLAVGADVAQGGDGGGIVNSFQ